MRRSSGGRAPAGDVADTKDAAGTDLEVAGGGGGLLIPLSTLSGSAVRSNRVLTRTCVSPQGVRPPHFVSGAKGTGTKTKSWVNAPDQGMYWGCKSSPSLSQFVITVDQFQHSPP